jgi:hypothetical protein
MEKQSENAEKEGKDKSVWEIWIETMMKKFNQTG